MGNIDRSEIFSPFFFFPSHLLPHPQVSKRERERDNLLPMIDGEEKGEEGEKIFVIPISK